MSAYFFKKIAGAIPLFLGITLISFAVIHLAPGTAVDARAAFNPKMTEAAKGKLREIYGLDKPVAVQYAHWLKRSVRFDFGHSFADGQEVRQKISQAVWVTLGINALSLFLILFFGVWIGIQSARRPGGRMDRGFTFLTLSAYSMPSFWLALGLMSFFGVTFRIFPVSGLHSFYYDRLSLVGKMIDTTRHLILPVSVSVLIGLAGISRFVRASVGETLNQNYIRTARAKGLDENTILYRHALRNALLPLITLLGLSLPGLLGGSVVIETVFSIPGMGRLFFNSVFTRDTPVIMGMLVIGAVLTLLGNLLADIAYGWADPRTRSSLR